MPSLFEDQINIVNYLLPTISNHRKSPYLHTKDNKMPVILNPEPEKSQTSQKETGSTAKAPSSSSSTTSSSAFSEQSTPSSTTSYSSDNSATNAGNDATGEPLTMEEANRLYEERMEDEYAKREGGA